MQQKQMQIQEEASENKIDLFWKLLLTPDRKHETSFSNVQLTFQITPSHQNYNPHHTQQFVQSFINSSVTKHMGQFGTVKHQWSVNINQYNQLITITLKQTQTTPILHFWSALSFFGRSKLKLKDISFEIESRQDNRQT